MKHHFVVGKKKGVALIKRVKSTQKYEEALKDALYKNLVPKVWADNILIRKKAFFATESFA